MLYKFKNFRSWKNAKNGVCILNYVATCEFVYICALFQAKMIPVLEKLHPCYYDPLCKVTLKENINVNGRMESKILYLLQDIQHHFKYLHKYWYNLKYFVQSLWK